MKYTKRLCSVFLALVILIISVCPVFAQDNKSERSFIRLAFMCNDYLRTFRFSEKDNDDRMECDPQSTQELLGLINEVHDIMDKEETLTSEEIDEYYTAIDNAAQKVVLVPKELKYLIDFCEKEQNDNLYYPSSLWGDFQSKLSVAKEVYNKGETSIEVSNAYWDLLFCYNDICTVNQLEGDVDFDGKVTVMDATLVQMCVADLRALNSSQLLVIGESDNENIRVTTATNLQRAVAGLSYDDMTYDLSSLIENPRSRLYDSNRLFQEYRDSFMPYNGLDQDNIYHPNVP